ncbi:MAG: hypothetical protein GC172_03490 [Phycisphaera sp.]|nr:hypothetical protein [Phycisphaera sp.]
MAACDLRHPWRPSAALGACAAALAFLFLAACGKTVVMNGTADEAWAETIAVLHEQGAVEAGVDTSKIDPERERPRFDRANGTIDLVYDANVYYGEGAAYLQLDIRRPEEARERSMRMWVDYPVGNKVVRYGRSIDDAATQRFHGAFVAAREAMRRRKASEAPPAGVPASDRDESAHDTTGHESNP